MPIFVRLHRRCVVSLLMISMLAACGGGSGGESAPGPTSEDRDAAAVAGLQSYLDLATNRVTLQWYLSFYTTSRYQIEQQDGSGAWVVIDGLWGSQPILSRNPASWTGVLSGTTTFRVEAVRSGYNVPLKTRGLSPSTSITVAAPAQTPSIALDQAEPLANPTGVSLTNAGTYVAVNYAIDAFNRQVTGSDPAPQPPDYAATWDPANSTTGTHRLYALLQLSESSTAVVSREVHTHSSKAAIQLLSTTMNPRNSLDAYVIATSDSGIASVVASVDTAPMENVTVPNTCVPSPCAAGAPFNAYHLSVDTTSFSLGSHSLDVYATDNAGNSAHDDASFTLPAPANATLDSPVDGAVVAGSLHISGSFWANTPGALEVLVALSGATVYDTTVANPGTMVPYSADVSLAGVTPGSHTLSVFSRVGNTNYVETASVVIQVGPAP